MHLLIVALVFILCIVGITLFASLFAVVNLLRAAVIFSNKHPTITPVIVYAGTKLEKNGTKIRDQIMIV